VGSPLVVKIRSLALQGEVAHGRSVAMNSDGSKCIVGGYGSKEAYIYAYDGTTWSEQVKLTPSGTGDGYGYSASMSSDGTKCIVGAYGSTEAYIYS